MIVEILNKGKFENIGTIRFEEKKVKINITKSMAKELFENIHYGNKIYKPDDGLEYMKIIIEKFKTSTAISLSLEKEDVWYEEKR